MKILNEIFFNFRLVECDGFRAFMTWICKEYVPFTRRTCDPILDKMFLTCRDTISEKLALAQSIASTFDLWSDKKGKYKFFTQLIPLLSRGEK